MKHKHAKMIKAKADNVELVVFFNPLIGPNAGKWEEATTTLSPAFHPETDYFLCLPQYKEACLRWLNGGEVQYHNDAVGRYCAVETVQEAIEDEAERLECSVEDLVDFNPTKWAECSIFMKSDFKLRIKPKKVKRWIATFPWCGNDSYVPPEHFSSEKKLDGYICSVYGRREYQPIEIEVEV